MSCEKCDLKRIMKLYKEKKARRIAEMTKVENLPTGVVEEKQEEEKLPDEEKDDGERIFSV